MAGAARKDSYSSSIALPLLWRQLGQLLIQNGVILSPSRRAKDLGFSNQQSKINNRHYSGAFSLASADFALSLPRRSTALTAYT